MQIEFARTGSVGTIQAAMTSDSRKLKSGIRPQTSSPIKSQPRVMIGKRTMKSESHSVLIYFLGKLAPLKKTWMPMMIRDRWSVKSKRVCWSLLNHSDGLMRFAHSGPKMTPAIVEGTASAKRDLSLNRCT